MDVYESSFQDGGNNNDPLVLLSLYGFLLCEIMSSFYAQENTTVYDFLIYVMKSIATSPGSLA